MPENSYEDKLKSHERAVDFVAAYIKFLDGYDHEDDEQLHTYIDALIEDAKTIQNALYESYPQEDAQSDKLD